MMTVEPLQVAGQAAVSTPVDSDVPSGFRTVTGSEAIDPPDSKSARDRYWPGAPTNDTTGAEPVEVTVSDVGAWFVVRVAAVVVVATDANSAPVRVAPGCTRTL